MVLQSHKYHEHVATVTGGQEQLVFASLESWDEVWRRNQFVCQELAQRGWEILFVEPAADWSAGLRHRRWEQFERRPVWSPEELPTVKVVRPVKVMPKAREWGEAVNRRLWQSRVNRVLGQLGWRRPHLWVNNQLLWRVTAGADRSRWSRVLYDVTDDWSSAGGTPAWLEQVRRDDAAMADAADAVVVCSQALLDARQARWSDKLHLVPNGVDLEHFARVDTAAVASELSELPESDLCLGYSGTAHPDRLDVGLVAAVARARPNWSWLFVGPNHLSAADRARLDLPNIRFLGPRPYADLPSYFAGVDVCVTPHQVTPFTESLNPLKLWEYLAVGKPIVSTPVAGFRELPSLVHLSDATQSPMEVRAKAWAAVVDHAVAENPQTTHARRVRAAGHGWPARVDILERLLTQAPTTLSADTSS